MSTAQTMIKLRSYIGPYSTLQAYCACSLTPDSAMVALYTPWLSLDTDKKCNSNFSRRARIVLQQITDQISTNLIEGQCFLGRDPEDMSPWGLYFAYRICAMQMQQNKGVPNVIEVVRSLREAFQTISIRWSVAGVYLQLLEAQEAIHLRK